MKYLLDTNVLIAMFRGRQCIRKAILKAGFENCLVSEITLAEIIYGAHKGGYEKHSHEIQFIKDQFRILAISDAIERYAQLRAKLESNGLRLDSFDLLIAASALSESLTLVTHNTKHFDRIPSLKIKDWEKTI